MFEIRNSTNGLFSFHSEKTGMIHFSPHFNLLVPSKGFNIESLMREDIYNVLNYQFFHFWRAKVFDKMMKGLPQIAPSPKYK